MDIVSMHDNIGRGKTADQSARVAAVQKGGSTTEDQACRPGPSGKSTAGKLGADSNKPETPGQVFLHRVALGGLKNYKIAMRPLEKRIWVLAIVIGVIAAIYHVAKFLIDVQASSNMITNDVELIFEVETIPAPNVTICSNVIINKTYVRETLLISPHIRRKITKLGIDDMENVYEQLAIYLAQTSSPKNIDNTLGLIFDEIAYENSNVTTDFSHFLISALPTCQQTMANCAFDSKPFNCCELALTHIFDNGICYKLPLNKADFGDRDGFDQRRPGERGGLTFDAVLDLRRVPYLDNTVTDGFTVQIAHAASSFGSPVVVATGRHVHIRVEPVKRHLRSACFKAPPVMPDLPYYDPNGIYCVNDNFNQLIYNLIGCRLLSTFSMPNSTTICHPQQMRTLFTIITSDFADHLSGYAESIGKPDLTNAKLQRKMIVGCGRSSRCLPLCQKWDYTTYVGYSDLLPLHSADCEECERRSRVSVYYGSMDYQEHRESQLLSAYVVVCRIGGLTELYASASFITVIQILAYGFWCVCKAVYDYKRRHQVLEIRLFPEAVIIKPTSTDSGKVPAPKLANPACSRTNKRSDKVTTVRQIAKLEGNSDIKIERKVAGRIGANRPFDRIKSEATETGDGAKLWAKRVDRVRRIHRISS